jgi:hypothetical protein
MDLYSAFASDTRMNNQVNTYNNSTLKKKIVSALQKLLRVSNKGTQNGLDKLSTHQSIQPHLVIQ